MSQQYFSVIIPTMQRSSVLHEVLSRCERHPLVSEILLINNSARTVPDLTSKVRVIDPGRNIFVNPAWNLGVREARSPLLAIINDDLLFEEESLTYAASVLRRGWFGVVGPDKTAFGGLMEGRVSHRPALTGATGAYFGTFMCLRRSDYVPIPEEMLIWGGDDWLIATQRRPPATLIRTKFMTEMSSTSGAPEFQRIRAEEQAVADRILPALRGTRWWHRPQEMYSMLRRWNYRRREKRSESA